MEVSATGVTPTGQVTLASVGQTLHGTLSGGHVSISLPAFDKAGKVKIAVSYGGSSDVASAKRTITLTVQKPKK